MSLKAMIEKQKVAVVLEFAKIGPENSDLPINVWFDKEHHSYSPRIKIQNVRGETNSDQFISFSANDYKFFHDKGGKHNAIPTTVINSVVDFVKDNQKLVDGYFGIDRATGRCSPNNRTVTEDEFRTKIIAASKEYFSKDK